MALDRLYSSGVRSVLWETSFQAGKSLVRFQVGPLGLIIWLKSSGRTMVLGSTQPLREMSNRDLSWDKGGRCLGLTTLPIECNYYKRINSRKNIYTRNQFYFWNRLKIIFNVIFQFMREPRRKSEICKGASGNCRNHWLKNTISKTFKVACSPLVLCKRPTVNTKS